MATNVIICGVEKPGGGIDAASLKQMAGRAGRRKSDLSPHVWIIAESEDKNAVEEILSTEQPVESRFANFGSLAERLLPRLADGSVHDETTARKWFSRSLACAQGRGAPLGAVLDWLASRNAAVRVGGEWGIGPFGRIAIASALPVVEICGLFEKFGMLLSGGRRENDAAIASCLSTSGIQYAPDELVEAFLGDCPSDFRPETKSAMCEAAVWWSIFTGFQFPKISNLKSQCIAKWPRLRIALTALDSEAKWSGRGFFNRLGNMVAHAAPYSLAELFFIPGMTKGVAEFLASQGISAMDELADGFEGVAADLPDDLRQSIEEEINRL